jgi:hypothetical protein
MRHNELPSGREKVRMQRTPVHDEEQVEAEAVAEDECVIEIHVSSPPLTTFMATWYRRMRARRGGPVQPKLLIEEVTDPVEVARFDAQDERARLNGDWLQAHWPELLPNARGKFLAVAGQEAFLAQSPKEALTLARAAHPQDDGVIVEYVRPERGPRLYAYPR